MCLCTYVVCMQVPLKAMPHPLGLEFQEVPDMELGTQLNPPKGQEIL